MTLSDPAAIPVPTRTIRKSVKSPGVIVRAKFDCMDTGKNMAIMGGEILSRMFPANWTTRAAGG